MAKTGKVSKRDPLGRVGDRLRMLPDEAVVKSSKIFRTAALKQLKADTGGDRRLSGLRNGLPLRVTVTKRGTELVEGRVMAGPKDQRAPWFWLEEGTRPGPRGKPFGRPDSRRANRGMHPGTPAKRTWSRSFESARGEAENEIDGLFERAVEG
jgi:hypothetical protein